MWVDSKGNTRGDLDGVILIPIDGTGYKYCVIAHGKGDRREELHGPLDTYSDAETYIIYLRKKYADYDRFHVVKIETPAVSS